MSGETRKESATAPMPRGTTDAWGIADGYHNASGEWMTTSDETRRSILLAMGEDPDDPRPPAAAAAVRVVRAGETPEVGRVELALEDGTTRGIDGRLPGDIAPGYHELRPAKGAPVRLIVTPPSCPAPPSPRMWGWAAQLYATRSRASWGFGDLADLRRLAGWSARELGAGMVLINPLHAPLPILSQEPSPYFPSSRRFRNPLYIRIEEVPGAALAATDLEPLARAGRALNERRTIDRDAVFALKMQALELLWRGFRDAPGEWAAAFERYVVEQGEALRHFAVFQVLAEMHGGGWRAWPAEHRTPAAPGVARVAHERAERVRFHAWLQWLLDEQLALASAALPVMQDLPIGVDPAGADGWAWQDVLATEASVGSPPDRYIRDGQDWGLPPFVPHRLRDAGYEPFIQTIRASLRNAGALRIDHVMGLFRLFWIPKGRPPAGGGYVRYPVDDLLGIVALESARANAFVVGEDLGTVEEGVRERLAEACVLSYRLLWFEPDPPSRYPRLALCAATTHDLPTIAGLWTGSDVADQQRIGLHPNEAAMEEIRERLRTFTGLGADARVPEVIEAAYRQLATAPCMIVTATLDDALAVAERPNMPGTWKAWPNWSLALPEPLEELERAPLARAIALALRHREVVSS